MSAQAKQLTRTARGTHSRSPVRSAFPSSCHSRQHAILVPYADGGWFLKACQCHTDREAHGFSYGLNWALASKGVVVKDRAFYNMTPLELKKRGTVEAERLSGLPLHIRGNVVGGTPDISRAQFSKLLKLVSTHLSSVKNLYVQDGAVGSSPICDAKVRVIADNPSAILSLSSILWKLPSRAISHDTCPLTIYVASSINTNVKGILGKASDQASVGFAVADIERSSLILCGKAFLASNVIKDALRALAAPVLSARGGIPLYARLLVLHDSVNLLFAPEEIIKSCGSIQENLISTDAGAVIFPDGSAPFFASKDNMPPSLLKKLASVILVSSDSTMALQSVSQISPGQAAYHFLAGYNDGNFFPAYNRGPSTVDPLALANSLLFELKESSSPCFLINAHGGGKLISGEELVKLTESALANKLPWRKAASDTIVGDLKRKYKSFLLGKFQKLPEEFTF
ncbi:Phosphoenolpyruvate carboxykinase [Carex littledalei]|uniref:phosphoenolpyruvate carboxykinase (ATP) n=1 Tax=Carex littledalei TaxID=544730 RepID=A0A833QC49_9POAL|nr:Phosphoenolpyruvate carboxykinase [Carex littledalei]